jgi:hypothetical protein
VRQIVQHLGSGHTKLLDVPAPGPRRGRLLVRATRSLVSLGTERMLVEFGRGGWFSKARQQPEKFRAVLAKIRSEGFFATLSAVRSKLAQPIPLGYCHVGQVRQLDHGFQSDALHNQTHGGHKQNYFNVLKSLELKGKSYFSYKCS